MNQNLPNYTDGSLVNLMSSIIHYFGGKTPYSPLKELPVSQLQGVENIVLIVLDGLGYNFFKTNAKLVDSPILEYLHSKITSVFPSTTAAAMTTIYTGLAPKNHGCLAWFTYLKEVGLISTIPPLKRRNYDDYITTKTIKAKDILQIQSIFERIPSVDSYFVISEKLKGSPYDIVVSKGAKVVGFTDFTDSLYQIHSILQKEKSQKRFIVQYWEGIDTKCHMEGIDKAKSHFVEIFTELSKFFTKIKAIKEKIVVMITADHGLVDVSKDHIINLRDHPELEGTLTLPLCGEGRTAFCYVRAPYREQFESYIREKLNNYCDLLKMGDLLAMELFGFYEPHPRFRYRIPDYILLMKENYIITDTMLKETRIQLKAVHGGLSDNELFVPLILFQN